jgi:monovalent cation:H+ antiporter-2, CPA2 family
MAAPINPADFKEALIVLATATVVIPVFHRLRLSPLLGFLVVGMAVGPYGLGALLKGVSWAEYVTITDKDRIALVAEMGVVFLLFMIGLELSFERLRMLRRYVLGLGPAQLILSAAGIGAAAWAMGLSAPAAIVVGLALAMSSTAVVVQVLADEKRLATPTGRASFSVLLFQDIAVVPVLFAVTILSAKAAAEASALTGFLWALTNAAIAVVAILVFGRYALRPLFRMVARTNSPELFMAACLLVLLGSGLAAAAAGLSMAIGALLAGLLLAETEYRRQVEVLIEPFKGLLLGVFLISIGMSINMGQFFAQPILVLALCVALILFKAAIVYGLARMLRVPQGPALESGLLLGPGGEFGFVILGAAAAAQLLSGAQNDLVLLVAALTMAVIPLMSNAGGVLSKRFRPDKPVDPALQLDAAERKPGRVVIAGFGRVGRLVADMLDQHNIPYLAVDMDPALVAKARDEGRKVYYGDMARPDFLAKCGLEDARALVVSMDAPVRVDEVVKAAKAARGDLLIVARARDAHHAARLYKAGATDAVPETIEASLLLSEAVLVDIGVPMGPVIASIHEKRDELRRDIQNMAPQATVKSRSKRVRDASVKDDGLAES